MDVGVPLTVVLNIYRIAALCRALTEIGLGEKPMWGPCWRPCAGPVLVDERHDPRRLFRRYPDWNSVAVNENAEVSTMSSPSERRLVEHHPDCPRQAFLCAVMERLVEGGSRLHSRQGRCRDPQAGGTPAGREDGAGDRPDPVLIIEDEETFIAMGLESW